MAINIDFKNLPSYAKVIISLLPGVILSVLVIVFLIMPKQEKIEMLEAKIDVQNNKIAASQIKAAKLEVLIKENEKLLNRVNELKRQLPEEKEISDLLQKVSDLGKDSGLEIKSWKPSPKKTHSSGIVYEIPVSVAVTGTYHNLGYFLGSLTRLDRIVNINNMKLGTPKKVTGENILQISFTAATFSSIPEAEMAKIEAGRKK